MKDFIVDVDITMSKQFHVEAENEEEAKTIVKNRIKDFPYFHARTADCFVCSEITDVYEEI